MEKKHSEEIGRQVIKMLYESGKTEDEINQLLFEEIKRVLCSEKHKSHVREEALQELMNTTSFKDFKGHV